MKLTPHFTRREARCSCDDGRECGLAPLPGGEVLQAVEETARRLELLRGHCQGRALRINSWYRCPESRYERDKPPGSLHRHTSGRAVDILPLDDDQRWRIMEYARASGFLSLGCYPWGLHLDWCDGDIARHWVRR